MMNSAIATMLAASAGMRVLRSIESAIITTPERERNQSIVAGCGGPYPVAARTVKNSHAPVTHA